MKLSELKAKMKGKRRLRAKDMPACAWVLLNQPLGSPVKVCGAKAVCLVGAAWYCPIHSPMAEEMFAHEMRSEMPS